MGTIVRLKVNRLGGITAQGHKDDAIGTIDEYGNPFRLIRLRWNQNPKHKNTEYAKTRGFQDAVLSKVRGELKITYRDNGSIMWERKNGMGLFTGECPQTPTNMRLLASHFGDKLWTIIDADIKEIVEKMYNQRRGIESPDIKKFNDNRVKMLHTNHFDYNAKDNTPPEIPVEVEKIEIAEKNRLNRVEETRLNQRKLALDAKEKDITERTKGLIDDGAAPVVYQKEFLDSQKLFSLRKLCKTVGVKWTETDKKGALVQMIMDKQAGNAAAVEEKTASIMGSLDS